MAKIYTRTSFRPREFIGVQGFQSQSQLHGRSKSDAPSSCAGAVWPRSTTTLSWSLWPLAELHGSLLQEVHYIWWLEGICGFRRSAFFIQNVSEYREGRWRFLRGWMEQRRKTGWVKKTCIKDNCHHMKTRSDHCDSGIEKV